MDSKESKDSKPEASIRAAGGLARVGRTAVLTLAAAVVASSAGLVAAGTAQAATSRASASTSGPLSIMGFGTNGDDVAQTRLKIAEKAIAPIKINAPNGGFSDASFLSDLASGNAPDLVYMDSYQMGTYAAKGALMPLTSCLKSQGINMKVFTKAAQAMSTYNKQVYGLPEFTDDRTLLVNNSVVDKAGLTPAGISTTNWTKLSEVAKQLTVFQDGKLKTIGFDPKLPEFFPIWVKANGGAILSPDGLKAELNSRQDIQALTYAVSLINEEGGYSKFLTYRNTWNYFGNNNPFAENQIGVTPFENWMYNVIASTSPKVPVTAEPFTNRKGKVIDYETGSVWVIPKESKDPTAACKFANAMTEASTWLAAANERIALYTKEHYYFAGLLTGNHKADAAIIKLAEAHPAIVGPFMQATKETYNVETGSFTVPDSPASEQVQNDWTQAVTSVLQGQASPARALDEAESQAQAAINAANVPQ
jgi:multiple sugar transport system substrate-binding protein